MKMKSCGLCEGSGEIITGDIVGLGTETCTVCDGQGYAPIPTPTERDKLMAFKLAMMHCDMEDHEETGLCECFERLLIMFRDLAGVNKDIERPPEICGCCGRRELEAELRRPMKGWVEDFGLCEVMCSDCIREWHNGETDGDKIKATVLARTS